MCFGFVLRLLLFCLFVEITRFCVPDCLGLLGGLASVCVVYCRLIRWLFGFVLLCFLLVG